MTSEFDKWSPEMLSSLGRLDFIAREVLDGVRQGIHRSVRRGFSSEFFDYKSYQSGDDARQIDWRLYSKTRKFFVKRFEAETSLECMMLIDMSNSMEWRWENAINKREYATVLTASLGTLFIEQRDLVGLFTFGERGTRFLPPKSSLKQLNSLFAVLGESGTNDDPRTLVEAVHELRGIQRHRGLAVLVSDLEVPQEEVIESLRILRARNDEVVVFHLLDRAEVDLPFQNATHFEDSETGHVYPVDFASLKRSHDQRIHEFRKFFERECRESRVTYVPLDTSVSYVEAILRMDQVRRDLF